MQSSNGKEASKSNRSPPGAVMVVGGGVAGMRASLDLADSGLKVYLIEQTPSLGGRVAQLGYMFPQHDCVLCRGTPDHGYGCTRPSISPAYSQHNQHPNIEILTNTRLVDIEGQAGDFTISLRQEPRFVDQTKCINCDYCTEVCPIIVPDEYQQGITSRKAIYKVSTRAAPDAYVIDRGSYCDDCMKCIEVCPSEAINLNEQPRLLVVEVGAIILALGFQTFDPAQLQELGYGRYPNVISAMEYERLASRSGPTEGIVTRISDNRLPQKIAWLQCIGSRDQSNMYCSSICCMYATKEAILAKERLGEHIDCSIFVLDERAFNKEYSRYFDNARNQYNIRYNHCMVSEIREDPNTKNLILRYADPNGISQEEQFEMVVLATGLQPPDSAHQLAKLLDFELNEFGFCETDKFTPLQTSRPGIFVCGAFASPKEIAETILDASGAAAEVMRFLNDKLNTFSFTREFPFLSSEILPPERAISTDPLTIGLFACTCCGTISETINLNIIATRVIKWPNIAHSEVVNFACHPDTLNNIKTTIIEKNLNRIVIAACSNRTHESLFQRTVRETGLNPYLLELVNLRDQCANVHHQQIDIANQKALELIRIAIGRVQESVPIHKKQHHCLPVALVIGGGVAGMTTSLALADSGQEVHLIEIKDTLGGNLTNLYYVAEGYNPQRLLRDLVNRVCSHRSIYVHTQSELIKHSGHVGDFKSIIQTKKIDGTWDEFEVSHGATIVATGGVEQKNHPLLEIPGIFTQLEFEEKIIHNPEEIAALKDVVMIQCVGPDGVANYCSRVCCTNTMKNAIRLKLFNPECRVTVLFKNIVTYGFREKFYKEARRLGTIFFRFSENQLPKIIYEHTNKINVQVKDLSLDASISLPADIVLLSTSIIPSPGTEKLAELLRVPLAREGFFEEAQLKLRPMDFMREGIFLAGMAAYPKFIEESISHGLAAAARALPLLNQETMHLGGIVASIDPNKCVGCLTCTRVCPFAIPQVIQEEGQNGVGGLGGFAYIDPAQCQGCGTCTGDCPANAIQLTNYTDSQMMLTNIGGLGTWQTEYTPKKERP